MTLNAHDIKRVMERYYQGLVQHRDVLNRLNVYPVPDGDTGTNMALTVGSVLTACEGTKTMAELSAAIAHGSLMGARGNSGVILSQILRGLSETFGGGDRVGMAQLIEGLSRAAEAAYESVVRPVEGTILTVIREAASGARESDQAEDLSRLIELVYARALQALEQTPDLLPVLKQAGVVDAGGAGLLLMFGAFVEETTGVQTPLPEPIVSAAVAREQVDPSQAPAVADLRYEVMFFLEAQDENVGDLKTAWSEIGDSIVVVGGDGTYNCHIHTDEIGRSIEAGIRAGRPYDIRVTDLLEQSADASHHRFEPLPAFAEAPLGVVAVAAGDGLREVFRELGVQSVVGGGQSMNPSTEELLVEVEQIPANVVVVLPNNKNIVPVAGRLDELSTKSVYVVPTCSIPEGIAAMLGYLPEGDPDAVVAGMERAAGEVVTGEITQAVRDAETAAGQVSAGDWLVLVEGKIAAVAADQMSALRDLARHAVTPEAELVTLFLGDGHEPTAVEAFTELMAAEYPDLEVVSVNGRQPLYPYLASIE